jgi:hypothetical protein
MDKREFAALLARAGLRLEADRMAVMREAVDAMQKLLSVLDEPLPYGEEPFSMPRFFPRRPQ